MNTCFSDCQKNLRRNGRGDCQNAEAPIADRQSQDWEASAAVDRSWPSTSQARPLPAPNLP
jgi:hypothetical protein